MENEDMEPESDEKVGGGDESDAPAYIYDWGGCREIRRGVVTRTSEGPELGEYMGARVRGKGE